MAIFNGKGIKPEYDFELAETSQNTSSSAYLRTLDFNGGFGVYKIRIYFMYNSYISSRSLMGGIKFTDSNNNDCRWSNSNLRLYSSSFYHWDGNDYGSNWWGDHEVWFPHMWNSSSTEALRNNTICAWYDICVRVDTNGKHAIWGEKGINTTGSAYPVDGRFIASSLTTTNPQKLVIDRYANIWWTQLSMQATKVWEA